MTDSAKEILGRDLEEERKAKLLSKAIGEIFSFAQNSKFMSGQKFR